MRRILSIAAIAVLAIMFQTGASRAAVIFDSLSGGYDPHYGWAVHYDGSLGSAVPAMGFTPTSTYDLEQIDLALIGVLGTQADLKLYAAAGNTPHQLIKSWHLSSSGGSPSGVQSITGITGVTLFSGVQYFLQASAADVWSVSWMWNNMGITGPLSWNGQSASTQTLAAFDVLGSLSDALPPTTSVPEPSIWVLMIVGAGLMGSALRWRRSAHTLGIC